MKLRVYLLLAVAAGGLLAQTGARYLIIANDNFYDAVLPLAEWKTRKGMQAVVVRTSQTGSSSTQIRSYIIDAYNTWNPRPEFVLLVGGPSFIPAFQHGMGGHRIDSDNDFGNISGDYRPEVPCGRFACKTLRQCSTMVAKTMTYERYPNIGDTLWYLRATTIANDSADDDAYTYWNDVRGAVSHMTAAGITSIDSLSSNRHHNAWSVTQSVNTGSSFVLYRGTGVDYWRIPFDMRPYFATMSNNKHTPIVCSFTCQTISLSSYNDSMTGNTWSKLGTPANLVGAVAVIGNTHSASSVAGRRSAMTRGFFSGVFAESLLYLGSATLRGKLQLYNEYRDSMDYRGFNLLGDPELNIRTSVPRLLAVSYPEYFPFGPGAFAVSVSKSGAPLRNALVCIQSASGIYQYGYTDELGQKSFSIDAAVEETLHVTVTARNCVPHEGNTWLYDPTAVTENSGHVRPTRDRLLVSPNPGRARFSLDAGAGARVSVHSSDGRLVWKSTFPPSGRLDWDARSVPGGVYVVQSVGPAGEAARQILRVVR
jgi:hypothetical protein